MNAMANHKTLISVGGKVKATDAAEYLGCAYSHMVNLLKAKKIKGQKIEKRWFVDKDDLERAKSTRLVSPKGARKGKTHSEPTSISASAFSSSSLDSSTTELRIAISKEKLEIIKLAFRGERTLIKHLNSHLEDIYNKVQTQLESISL